MPKVSVIVPIYNAGPYLEEAIESVLQQTYTDFELLLINDGSTDNSKDICEKYGHQDGRIVLLENDSAIHGPGPTRNIGLEYATGEYIYFMDRESEVCTGKISFRKHIAIVRLYFFKNYTWRINSALYSDSHNCFLFFER